MRTSLITLLFLTFSFAAANAGAQSCESKVPRFQMWRFANVILRAKMTNDEKVKALGSACALFDSTIEGARELNEMAPPPYLSDLVITAMIAIPDAFRTMGGTALENRYKKRLIEIKALPSAEQRVKAVYELWLAQNLPYDYVYAENIMKSDGRAREKIFLTPNETLRQGGVCRDFARLLEWSLNQVARSSSTSREAEVFSVERQSAYGKKFGHAWVSVNLPIRAADGHVSNFERIDLDPTNQRSGFVPLAPMAKRQPRARLDEYFNQCAKIVECLKPGRSLEHLHSHGFISNADSSSSISVDIPAAIPFQKPARPKASGRALR